MAIPDPLVALPSTIKGLYTVAVALLICNTDTTAITVSLWLETSGAATKYILKSVEIESGYTLDVFDGIPFIYDDNYKLNISLGHSDYVAEVIMNEIIP